MLSWRTHAISGAIGLSSLAHAKPALALLPISRRLQSSQAVEIPQISNPETPKRRGGRQLAPWRLKRLAYERVSPSAVILHRLYTRGSRMTREQWELFQDIAQQKSTRLPVMTAQMLLRREETSKRTSLSDRLADEDLADDDSLDDDTSQGIGRGWARHTAMLAHTGITQDHLDHWVWILQGETADERVSRFLSAGIFKPQFLLLIMISKDHSILDRQLFMYLLDYVKKTHCQAPPQAARHPLRHRSLDSLRNTTPQHFLELLSRLVNQARRLCPEALLKISDMVTSYLKTIPASSTSYDNGFAAQCRVLNRALDIFSRRAYLQPYANIEYNWEAQEHLLAFSNSLKRPLIMNKAGYRAIQSVMVGREKSEEEEKVAIRSSKSWPPYREAWDGVDERRRPEDDLSRAVKTGILAREAGYPEDEIDRALGALGGAILGEGPSVQTRSHPPTVQTGDRENEAVYLTWAAKVRATRNAQEAWAVFRSFPATIAMPEGAPPLQPSAQVYTQMFAKLLAREVRDPTTAVPGNAREVMPTYQPGNLSEFEKWRLQPPTVAQLYDRMLRSGVAPIGRLLGLLIESSGSEAEVLVYLRDSPYKQFAAAVAGRDASCPPSEADFLDVVDVYHSVPLQVFGSYISFLCKMQRDAYSAARIPAEDGSTVLPPAGNNSYLQRALVVVALRLRPEIAEGRTFKAPWYDILRTMILARTHRELVTVARCQLDLFLRVFGWVRTQTGMDSLLLNIACLSAGRVMAANFTRDPGIPGERSWARTSRVGGEDDIKVLALMRVNAMNAFEEMKKPGSGMGGFQVHAYLRVLGMYGAVGEMVVAVRWVLAMLEARDVLSRWVSVEGTPSHRALLRAFGFAEGYLEECGRGEDVMGVRARRMALFEQGYPYALGEDEAQREREDVAFVRAIAKGWKRVC